MSYDFNRLPPAQRTSLTLSAQQPVASSFADVETRDQLRAYFSGSSRAQKLFKDDEVADVFLELAVDFGLHKANRETVEGWFEGFASLFDKKSEQRRTEFLSRKTLDGKSMLDDAIGKAHGKAIKFLLEKRAPVDSRMAKEAWKYALNTGDLDCVTILVVQRRSVANINMQDPNGQTALILATAAGDHELVKILLANKADHNLRDRDGCRALDLAFIDFDFSNIANSCKIIGTLAGVIADDASLDHDDDYQIYKLLYTTVCNYALEDGDYGLLAKLSGVPRSYSMEEHMFRGDVLNNCWQEKYTVADFLYFGATPLSAAVFKGDVDLVKDMLAYSKDFTKKLPWIPPLSSSQWPPEIYPSFRHCLRPVPSRPRNTAI